MSDGMACASETRAMQARPLCQKCARIGSFHAIGVNVRAAATEN
jgi:hypothetical protein